MDTRSLIYFCEATRDLNFTKTAARLFISQQDLSNHIARLEKEFNCKLFERKPRLTLTYSGQCLYDFAQQYRLNEDNIRSVLSDIQEKAEGTLSIGCSPYRTAIVMHVLAQRFNELYPNVHLEFYSYHSDELLNMLISGRLDCSISVNRLNTPLIETEILFKDSLYLMVSRQLLYRTYGENYAERLPAKGKLAKLNDFSDLPFLKIFSVHLIDDIFMSAGITPRYSISVTRPSFLSGALFETIAASIITKTIYLHISEFAPEDILFIPLLMPQGMPLNPISFMRNPKKHFSKFCRVFYTLTKNYFDELAVR